MIRTCLRRLQMDSWIQFGLGRADVPSQIVGDEKLRLTFYFQDEARQTET